MARVAVQQSSPTPSSQLTGQIVRDGTCHGALAAADRPRNAQRRTFRHAIPVIDAMFDKTGDARDFWTERVVSHDEEVALTWYGIGESADPHPTRSSPGPSIRSLHGVDPSVRGTPDGQWRSGEGLPVSCPAQGQTVQHLCLGFLRELDRGTLTPSVAAVETRCRATGLLPCGCLPIKPALPRAGQGGRDGLGRNGPPSRGSMSSCSDGILA